MAEVTEIQKTDTKIIKKDKKERKKLPKYYTFGRPTKYKSRFCKQIIKYFDVPYTESKLVSTISKSGNMVSAYTEVCARIPLIEGFCREIGVDRTTLLLWTKKHKEFSHAYTVAKSFQKDMLISLSARGLINPTYAVFLTKCMTDLKEVNVSEVDLTSKGEKIQTVNITAVAKDLKAKRTDELQREA